MRKVRASSDTVREHSFYLRIVIRITEKPVTVPECATPFRVWGFYTVW